MVSTSAMRRLRAVFLRPLHSRSRRLQQTKNATRHAQTRVFAGYGAFSGKEPDREQREKSEPEGPETGAVRGTALKRLPPETAPTLALRAEKNPTDKGWVFKYWWWGSTPHQTTIESTQSKRCGLLRTRANRIEKAAGTTIGRGRSSRFFAQIGHRKERSTSYAFRGQFNSRNRNRTRVRCHSQ